MSNIDEINKLEARKQMALYQRKITTQLSTVIVYDQELEHIENRLEELRMKEYEEQSMKEITKL